MTGLLSLLQNVLWQGRPAHETRARCPCHMAGIALLVALLGAWPAAGAESATARSPWHMPDAPPLRVFSFRGYWYPLLQLERAWARLGGVEEISRWSGPHAPMRFPTRPDAISRYHVIVVMDMDIPSWPEGALELCRDYVRRGGSMIFFGGLYAFREGYAGSLLEDISPVRFRSGDSLTHAPDGIVLRPGPDADVLLEDAIDWSANPAVYWYHAVDPKPDSLVMAQSGDAPILVAGRYGAGRVAVFAGTVMGDPPTGQTPFWMWEDWPELMARTIRWLTAPDPARMAITITPFTADLEWAIMDTLKVEDTGRTPQEREVLDALLAACRRNPTPTELLKYLAGARHDIPPAPADALVDALHGRVDSAAVAAAAGLIDADRPVLAGAGLRILAMAPPDGLVTALETIYRQRELTPIDPVVKAIPGAAPSGVEARNANLDIDDILNMIEQSPGHTAPLPTMTDARLPDPDQVLREQSSRHQFQLAAVAAMGYAGQADSIPFLRRVIAEHRRDRSRDPHEGWGRKAGDALHDEALLAALLCGDATAAAAVVELLLQHDFTVVGMFGRGWSDRDATRREDLHAAARHIRAWSWRAANRLRQAPPAVLPALAARIAEAKPEETWIVPLAHRLLGRSLRQEPLPATAQAALRASPIPAVNELVTD